MICSSMRQSAIVSEVLLACFVVLVKIPEITTATSKDEFLAGVNTPVWIAEIKQKGVVYTRVPHSYPPIILKSLYHWDAFKQDISVPSRVVRSVDDWKNITSPGNLAEPSDATEESFYSPSPVEKRSTTENEVVYPSIMVVMDYPGNYLGPLSSDKSNSAELYEFVLYALAFWGSVNRSLRNIINPRVSLRIAGIIIATSRDTFPYMSSSGGPQKFVAALTPMISYWRGLSYMKKDLDLPIGSYDIVAHMTTSYPVSRSKAFPDPNPENEPIFAVGSQGPPCMLPDRIAGLIVYDDFSFYGLLKTVAQMTKVLGGNELSAKDYGWPSKRWTAETLIPLSKALRTSSCMTAPKEYHPPGAPVPSILAGEVMGSEKRCAVNGETLAGWSCWDTPMRGYGCYYLRCSNRHAFSDTCREEKFMLDGNYCNAEKSKICLDGQCLKKDGISRIPNDIEPSIQVTTTRTTKESPRGGFLAGEETPVWIAGLPYRMRDDAIKARFDRVQMVDSIMKRAFNYWASKKKENGFSFRKHRSIDGRGNLTHTETFYGALRNPGTNNFDSPNLVEKRSADSNGVVYPSVLVVMDYKTSRTIEDYVLYALAFWGTVDRSLRHIQNPRVSLRISGIIITTSREVTPYLKSKYYGYTFAFALPSMRSYWKALSKYPNNVFPVDSYDIVAHMTDIFPGADREHWYLSSANRNKPKPGKDFFVGVASRNPLCQYADRKGLVIFRDDFGFDGINRAIVQMRTVLGGRNMPPQLPQDPPREWTRDMLDTLSNVLKKTSCMAAPKEHFPPGTPLAPILAGELVPNEKQCERAGYKPDAWTCWDADHPARRSTCKTLQCSNAQAPAYSDGVTCSPVGPPTDGSFCNVENTKICLDGECVDKI